MTMCGSVRNDLGMADDQFKFLTTEEFRRLPVEQKVAYLERAIEAINRLKREIPNPPEQGKQKRK
jgi:hypothetical protein